MQAPQAFWFSCKQNVVIILIRAAFRGATFIRWRGLFQCGYPKVRHLFEAWRLLEEIRYFHKINFTQCYFCKCTFLPTVKLLSPYGKASVSKNLTMCPLNLDNKLFCESLNFVQLCFVFYFFLSLFQVGIYNSKQNNKN